VSLYVYLTCVPLCVFKCTFAVHIHPSRNPITRRLIRSSTQTEHDTLQLHVTIAADGKKGDARRGKWGISAFPKADASINDWTAIGARRKPIRTSSRADNKFSPSTRCLPSRGFLCKCFQSTEERERERERERDRARRPRISREMKGRRASFLPSHATTSPSPPPRLAAGRGGAFPRARLSSFRGRAPGASACLVSFSLFFLSFFCFFHARN